MLKEKPWWAPRSPDEIVPVPWLHASAISYLEEIMRPDFRVLEHGAGGSTLWFAERAESVVTVEHDPAWREAIRNWAPSNVTLLTALDHTLGQFDLFFIDGEHEQRARCLEQAYKIVKPGGWVVLDNANRPEYVDEREAFAEHAVRVRYFDNNIPRSKYFVTEFWRCRASE